MGSIEKRLARLEERAEAFSGDEEESIRRETLKRVTDEDLNTYAEYLRRVIEEGGGPTEEEEAALRRYEELREEVRDGR